MKFLFDYFPIICFFIAYKFFGIFVATAVTMAASLFQMGFFWFKNHRFEKVHIITLILILFLGSSTLIFHEAIFIKWKPSVIYWVFSLILFISQYVGKKNILQRMLGDKVKLPDVIWKRLNFAWTLFFFIMGFINLYVVYHFSTDTWVNFKLFGTLGLMLIFIIIQAFYMARHMQDNQQAKIK